MKRLNRITAANRVDCPARLEQGEPLTPPSVRVTYSAVRNKMGLVGYTFP